MEEEKKYLND
jgi:(p)ppGpp synthase/HD superfamily hydrolase